MKLFIGFAVTCLISHVRAQSRIAGGEVADITQYPFATALLNNIGSASFRQVCGGTILTSTAILSAASCFVIENQITPVEAWRARVGSTSSETGGLVYAISRITTHPLFASATRESDLAVIRTDASIAFSAAVQPAYIAGGAYKIYHNDWVVAIGWGATGVVFQYQGPPSPQLRRVRLGAIDLNMCAGWYDFLNITITDTMLCAWFAPVESPGQCVGDTGGPLLHNGVVVGVFSWVQGCGTNAFPSINTRVAPYARWVEAVATA